MTYNKKMKKTKDYAKKAAGQISPRKRMAMGGKAPSKKSFKKKYK